MLSLIYPERKRIPDGDKIQDYAMGLVTYPYSRDSREFRPRALLLDLACSNQGFILQLLFLIFGSLNFQQAIFVHIAVPKWPVGRHVRPSP